MKSGLVALKVEDLDGALGEVQQRKLMLIASKPRRAYRMKAGGLLVWHDWRRVCARYLRRCFPRGWVYQGGRHVALHASPPSDRWLDRHGTKRTSRDAGRCLARICEVRS